MRPRSAPPVPGLTFHLALLSSELCDSVPQRAGVPGLLHPGRRSGCGLWSLHPLVHPLLSLLLPLLVPTHLQGFQVSLRRP